MNNWNITGNLGNDCRTNNVNGSSVINFSVAVKSGWGDKAQTIWVDCAVWGKQAEGRLSEFLLKGQQVAVTGELGTREHEGKTYTTLRATGVDLIGGKSEGGQQQQAPAPQQQPRPQPQPFGGNGRGGFEQPAGQQQAAASPTPHAPADVDDDIPFS